MFNKAFLVGLLASLIALSGCEIVRSLADGTHFVWRSNDKKDSAKTPSGFVVTAKEMIDLMDDHVLPTKYAWRLYADDRSYYFEPELDLFPPFGTNSQFAMQRGVRVNGRSRDDFEKLRAFLINKSTDSVEQMKRALQEAGPNQALKD